MQNEFVNRLKNIQDELLAIKTNSKYTQAKPINYASVDLTQSGVYRITYKSNDENILSFVANAYPYQIYEEIKPRTVENNTQDVEVYVDPDMIGSTVKLTIVATAEVLSVVKIS